MVLHSFIERGATNYQQRRRLQGVCYDQLPNLIPAAGAKKGLALFLRCLEDMINTSSQLTPGRDESNPSSAKSWNEKLIYICQRGLQWGQCHVPPGLRSIAGLILIVAGIFGFLPILGFWMLPLGVGFIALDIPPLRRRLLDWLDCKSEAMKKTSLEAKTSCDQKGGE